MYYMQGEKLFQGYYMLDENVYEADVVPVPALLSEASPASWYGYVYTRINRGKKPPARRPETPSRSMPAPWAAGRIIQRSRAEWICDRPDRAAGMGVGSGHGVRAGIVAGGLPEAGRWGGGRNPGVLFRRAGKAKYACSLGSGSYNTEVKNHFFCIFSRTSLLRIW